MRLSKASFDFGEIPLKGVYEQSVKIEEGIEDFHYMFPSCSCGIVTLKDNTIHLEFTPEKSISKLEKGQTMFKPVYVHVYLDEEIPEFVADDNGRRILNSYKKRITIPINYLAVGV